jgi:hypothetical protein
MITLDGLFGSPPDWLAHPRLRTWRARLAWPGITATLEVFRPESELGQTQPEMNLQFTEDGKLLPLETVPWDDDLNAGLIQLRVRATNPGQEAERFALGLRAAMQKPERELGDGYFNAVLIELLRDSDLPSYPAVAAVLEHAYANRPFREGKGFDRYNLCREWIADAISGRAHEMKDQLGYTEEEAKPILVQALARYLDDRFSVSSRRRLGLL